MPPRIGLGKWLLGAVSLSLALGAAIAAFGDTLVYKTPQGKQVIEGKLAARAGSELLFAGRDGRMHLIDPANVLELKETDEAPAPLSREEFVAQLRGEFGSRFAIHETNHYVLCYDCDPAFAKSCGILFERLYAAFTNYFEVKKVPLAKPDYPLVAIVFGRESDFKSHLEAELEKQETDNVIGFYSFLTNRMALYDMTVKNGGANRGQIENAANNNVATVIHEATHQLAYNTGLHRRFSDTPLWFAEGMAMFFEAPNRQGPQWKGIGEVNKLRISTFRDHYLKPGSPPPNIEALISSDKLLRAGGALEVTYAESWALTYFLMKTKPMQFSEYLKLLATKPPLAQDTPEQRLADFRAAFGPKLDRIEAQFLQYMRNLR